MLMNTQAQSPNILIVDDEADIRNLIQGILEDNDYSCAQAESAGVCFQSIEASVPDLIILDIWLQGSDRDGLEILAQVKADHPFLPVIMISGHGTIETAVSAIKKGAYDFIEKPFKSDRLLMMIRRALEAAALQHENKRLKQARHRRTPTKKMIGSSDVVKALDEKLRRAASSNSRVMLTGERGTGKEVAAGLIHQYSSRREEAFVGYDCRESVIDDVGDVFDLARGGTLYLGSLDKLSADAQGQLVKSIKDDAYDVRLIIGAPEDLEALILPDLYALINVANIKLPPLRTRSEDVPALLSAKMNVPARSLLKKEAWDVLQSYKWPGNVNELNLLGAWLRIMNDEGDMPFSAAHLPPYLTGVSSPEADHSGAPVQGDVLGLPLREAREVFEKFYLAMQIDKFDGNISKTAAFIGMERSALHRKIKNLNLHESEENSAETIRKRA